MIVLWIITLCMTAIFAYMTLKQNGLKRFVPGSILAGIALITYVISIFIESVSVDMSTSLMFIGITLFAGSIMVLMVAGIILFIHMNSETLYRKACPEGHAFYPFNYALSLEEFCCFSKSRISPRRTSSFVGSGISSSFFFFFLDVSLLKTLTNIKIEAAIIKKSKIVWMKLPYITADLPYPKCKSVKSTPPNTIPSNGVMISLLKN